MKKLLLICILFLTQTSISQSLDKFTYLGDLYGNNERYFGINPTFSIIQNKAAPFPKHHYLSGFTGDISARKVNFEKGSLSWNWQNKMFADVLLLLNKSLTGTGSNILYNNEQTGFTCGVLGWANFTWGMNQPTGKFQWSLGFNLHDYFYGSTYKVDTINGQNWASLDPQGYYFAAGPTVKLNYLLNKTFMVEMSNSYSISYWKALDVPYATNTDPNYPLPHWGQINVEIQSKWGIFAGFNYNWIINRGNIPSAGNRFDLIFGFRFVT